MSRKCGACRACCVVMGVKELEKEAFTPCEHLKKGVNTTRPCMIYANRPTTCGQFDCGWKQGIGPSSLRPDKSGLMFTAAHIPSGNGFSEDRHQFQVYNLRQGDFTSQAKQTINRFAQHGVVIEVGSDGSRTILGGPQREIAEFIRIIREHKEAFSDEE